MPVAKIVVMVDQTPTDLPAHRVRPARSQDLARIAAIEDAGGPQFQEHFGADINPILLSPATDGRQRAAEPGFLLVAADEQDAPIGFVHVLVIEGHAHLEQISVLPEHQQRGIGRALVEAAMAEARSKGFDRLSLCTFRDVPWNGPYYRSLGFRDVAEADLAPYEARLREKERELGLDVNGVRVVMSIALR
jgi:ribosomal protein S18 acetylase RimI-like enzyme